MTRSEEVYVEGDHVVQVIRTPLRGEGEPEAVGLPEFADWWNESRDEAEVWNLVPCMRLKALGCMLRHHESRLEGLADFVTCDVPLIPVPEMRSVAEEWVWALANWEGLEHPDQVRQLLYGLLAEAAAEAFFEIRREKSTRHKWLEWMWDFAAYVPDLQASMLLTEDDQVEGYLCPCCQTILTDEEAKTHRFRQVVCTVFKQCLEAVIENEDDLIGLETYDFRIDWP